MTMERTAPTRALEAMARGTGRRSAPIDLVHLARQTFGSAELEREILGLFVAQSRGLVARIAAASPGERAALVHRLKGSAFGVGAIRVGRITEALEAPEASEADAARLIGELAEACEEVRGFVEAIR